MERKDRTPSPALVEQYRRQMMALYGQQTPPPDAEDNWLDHRFPKPDIARDREVLARRSAPEATVAAEVTSQPEATGETMAPPTTETAAIAEMAEPEAPTEPPPIAETPFVGYLRVFVFTGKGAEPLPGALVTVTRGDTVYANTVTDRDGYTQVIPLPSVNPELTLTPGAVAPYATYNIRVVAERFRPVRHENVPVYGNNYVTQPVGLLPVVPGTDPEAEQNFVSGGPTNL